MFDRSLTAKELRLQHQIRFHHLNHLAFRDPDTDEFISLAVFRLLPVKMRARLIPCRGNLAATVATIPGPDGTIRTACVFASEKEPVISKALGRKLVLERLESGLAYCDEMAAIAKQEVETSQEAETVPDAPRHFLTLESSEVEDGFRKRTILEHFDGGRAVKLAPPTPPKLKYPVTNGVTTFVSG